MARTRAAAVVLSALTLVACGRGGAPGARYPAEADTAAVVRQAAGRTVAAGTARVDLEVTSTSGARLVHLSGVTSLAAPMAEMSSVAPDGSPALELRVLGPVSYLRRPDGPGWVRLGGDGLGENDPSALLRLLAGVGRATPLGRLRVGDEATEGHAFDLALPLLGAAPASLWTDGAGRVRRLVIDAPAATEGARTVLELSDFGLPLTVVEPPPEEIVGLDHPPAGGDAVPP